MNFTLFSFSFSFTLRSAGTAKPTIRQVLFFLLTIARSGRLAEIRWPVCMTKSSRILYIPFSGTDSGLCLYHMFVWSNLNFLHNSQWITLPAQSSQVLHSLCAIIIIIIIQSWRVFHISFSWWSFTGVWVIASLQDSSQYPGHSQ